MIKTQSNLREQVNFSPLLSGNEKNVTLVNDIVKEILDYIIKISPALKNISKKLRSGKTSDANSSFTVILEGIDWVAQLVTISKERYGEKFINLKCNNSNANELENELLNILTELIPVQIKKDWLLMADMIEYELYRNLNAWGTIFPQIITLEENL